jgi:hypothetical protein
MQSGVKNFKFTDLSNLGLIERAKQEASAYAVLLEKFPKLNNRLKTKELVWRN